MLLRKKTYTPGIYAVALAGVWALLSCFLALTPGESQACLLDYPKWGVAKSKVAFPLMGVKSFMEAPQALAGGHLNLGAWHGFHQVTHRVAHDPSRVAFTCSIDQNAYLYFLFNLEDAFPWKPQQYLALRLSTWQRLPCAWLVVDHMGRFLESHPLEPGTVPEGTWLDVEARFAPGAIDVFLEGSELARIPRGSIGEQHIAFRGGYRNAAVDDVLVWGKDGEVVVDQGFDGKGISLSRFGFWFAMCGLLSGAVVLAGYAAKRQWRYGAAAALSLSACALAVIGPLYVFNIYIQPYLYPVAANPHVQAAENDFIRAAFAALQEGLQEVPCAPAEGTSRILFFGTSQTWGAGARSEEQTLAAQCERLLASRGIEAECIAIAVSGAKTDTLVPFYVEHLSDLGQVLVVANLGTNDGHNERFAENLRRFIAHNRKNNVPVLLLHEARAPETNSYELPSLSVIREVAGEFDLPFLDMYKKMKRHQGEGFLWWDIVHPTSLGYRVLAEELAPHIEACLGEQARHREETGP